MKIKTEVGIILLAAGGSSRLGSPKQLVKIGDETLLERAIRILSVLELPMVVVLGANFSENFDLVRKLSAKMEIYRNERWEEGISTSIRSGLECLNEKYEVNSALFALADQPLIPSSHFEQMIDNFSSSTAGIIATEYLNSVGVPAIFDEKYFVELRSLISDSGAKKIIYSNFNDVLTLQCEEAGIDIDTKNDVKKLFLAKI